MEHVDHALHLPHTHAGNHPAHGHAFISLRMHATQARMQSKQFRHLTAPCGPMPTPRACQADLTDLPSLPATLVGVSAIIDCATARPEESTQKVDWEGKVALIQCAQAMGIQRYIFFSIFNCEKHPEVPLMNIKACTEEFLASSGVNYTILRLCGFMQVGAGCSLDRAEP